MKNLQDYRQEIDVIDEQIIILLNERFRKSIEIKEFKKERSLPIENKDREEEIKNKILNTKTSETVKEKILGVYACIFKSSKELQE